MAIQYISIQNFRNLEDPTLELSPGLNVLEGENAQGKTNLLEAMYFLANGRSFRTSHLESLIAFGSPGSRLLAGVEHGDLESKVEMFLSEARREVQLSGKKIHGMAKIHRIFRVLIYTPESTALFRTSPGARRRYFDLAIGVHRFDYPVLLGRYSRVLKQRNQTLEQSMGRESREPFDRLWAELSLGIMQARAEYLRDLLPYWRGRLSELTQTHAPLSARWEGRLSLEEHGDVASLLEALWESAGEEERYRRTVLGPNRDDLWVGFGSQAVREVASQGQHRMLTIALKLAQADLFVATSGNSPVFLLDDIGNELDPHHMERLLGMLSEIHAQTLLTTAHPGSYDGLRAKNFWVEKGKILEKAQKILGASRSAGDHGS